MEKDRARQDDEERGGGRRRGGTVPLMYRSGPASVIKQRFSAFAGICFLSPRSINDKHGRQRKQMSTALANQDLLDAFCCCCCFYLEEVQALSQAEMKNMSFFSPLLAC